MGLDKHLVDSAAQKGKTPSQETMRALGLTAEERLPLDYFREQSLAGNYENGIVKGDPTHWIVRVRGDRIDEMGRTVPYKLQAELRGALFEEVIESWEEKDPETQQLKQHTKTFYIPHGDQESSYAKPDKMYRKTGEVMNTGMLKALAASEHMLEWQRKQAKAKKDAGGGFSLFGIRINL